MHQYDVILKSLLRNSIARVTGTQVVAWLPTELPAITNLNVDLLGKTGDGGLVHIELQTFNDPEMPFRMLRYLGFIVQIHKQIPKQIVLYVGRLPLSMGARFEWDAGHIEYDLIDVRTLDAEPLLSSPEASDNVLAILCRLNDARDAIHRILARIQQLPRDQTDEYYQALLITAGLRELEQSVVEEAKAVLTIDISDNKVLGPAYQRGLERGLERGVEQGQLLLLRRMIEQKFGKLPRNLDRKLSSYPGTRLSELGIKLLDAKSLAELFDEQSL